MSIFLKLDSSSTGQNPNDFSVKYDNFILEPNVNHEIALIRANVWFTWKNVSASFNNNQIRYYNGTTWRNVVFPDGMYGAVEMTKYLRTIMKTNGDYLPGSPDQYYIQIKPNFTTLKIDVEISNNYQVDFSIGNFHTLLGFTPKIVTASESSTEYVNITNSINSLQVHCNIAEGSYENSRSSDIIGSFSPKQKVGTMIHIEPKNPIYLPLRTRRNITDIRMRLTDQLNRLIDTQDPITYILHIRHATNSR